MKKILTLVIFIATAIFISLAPKIYANSSDTLVVYANGLSLDQIINSDTTSSGLHAHSVYKLVSLDTTYLYLGPIASKSSMTIVGVPGSNGRPPCIQPGILSNGSVANGLCVVSKAGSRVTFKNIYLFGRTGTNTWFGGAFIKVTSDSTKLYLDNVIADECHGGLIIYTGLSDDFFVTNCVFRNSVWPANWTSPAVLRPGYPTANPVDSVIMDNNTFLCYESNGIGIGHTVPSNYIEFKHNTMVYNFEFALGTDVQYAVNVKIEDNVFYGVYAGGVKYSKYHAYYYQHGFAPVSCVEFDTLSLVNSKLFDPADSSNANLKWLAEAKRIAIVRNNDYFQPKALTDFWTAWNDTSHVDSLITPLWMNPETQNMFNDKTHWPGFEQSSNLDGVDPGFGSSFQSVLQNNSGTPGVVSLLQFITEVQTGTIKTDEWGYQKQTVTGAYWIPAWPLPETSDMQYANATVKNNSTDGKPLGDPRWYNGGLPTSVQQTLAQLPDKFELYQSYPNPFNPSTNIKFSLGKDGNVNLSVYNVMGQLVKTIVDNSYMSKGEHEYNVNMDNFASGIYFYTLRQGSNIITKKMVLLK